MTKIKDGQYFVTFRTLSDGQQEISCAPEIRQWLDKQAEPTLRKVWIAYLRALKMVVPYQPDPDSELLQGLDIAARVLAEVCQQHETVAHMKAVGIGERLAE